MSRRFLSPLIVFGLLVGGSRATAQGTNTAQDGGHRLPVVVAIADNLPPDEPAFRIVRGPQTVILVPANASPELLTQAVETLRAAGTGTISSTGRSVQLRASGAASTRQRTSFPWAARVLADLEKAELRQLPEVGFVRWVMIYVPRGRAQRP